MRAQGSVMTIQFHGRVAIVTGAGAGLGRSHALGLAARGAKVVVNDLGRNGAPSDNALSVVEEIRAAGGTAIADPADVADFDQVSAMAARAERTWGRVDILVNNAGVLRDKTFAKMEMADFDFVLRVHLIGSANCAKAVWAGMRERNYGRIVLTSSASGIYGNFGQANYGAAKAGMIGLMNVLHLEGLKHDIRVNVLAPTARTGMTEGLLTPVAAELMTPEIGDAWRALSRERGRALARHSWRRGRRVRRDAYRRDAGRLSRRERTDAGGDRRALCGHLRPEDGSAARQCFRADDEVRRGGGEGEGRQAEVRSARFKTCRAGRQPPRMSPLTSPSPSSCASRASAGAAR